MAGHVYVSYDGRDVGYVRRLVDHLAGSWLTVWVDKEAGAGDRWYADLEAPIRAASVVLVIMSPASQNSERVRSEITYAHRIGRPIIPLLLAGRPFFSQGGNPPESVIGGEMPDDSLIDRLGELSQTPITHRKSGKPGRGSASRERNSTTSTGTALLAPMRSPGYTPRRQELPPPDDDSDGYDDPPSRLRPAVLATVAGVIVLVAGVMAVVLFAGSGPKNQPTAPVAASATRTTDVVTTPASPGPTPTSTPSASTSTSKKPSTTTKTTAPTTTTTTSTTAPPPTPGLTLSISPASIVVDTGTATGTITLDSAYPSGLTVFLTATGSAVTIPGSLPVPANQTVVTFQLTAGANAGTATVTATLGGHSSPFNVDLTA
jgi:hypothetical protein